MRVRSEKGPILLGIGPCGVWEGVPLLWGEDSVEVRLALPKCVHGGADRIRRNRLARVGYECGDVQVAGAGGIAAIAKPLVIFVIDAAEAVDGIPGFHQTVCDVDILNNRGIDDTVGQVGMAHEIAGQALSRLKIAEPIEDEVIDNRPVFNSRRELFHAEVALTFRIEPILGTAG